jgi:hypothetical protein
MGIEPTQSAWKAEVLPLNYTRFMMGIIVRGDMFVKKNELISFLALMVTNNGVRASR